MSSRIDALEARRRILLHKCEEQRLELAYRVAQIKPGAQLTAWTRSGKGAGSPLAWIAALAGLLLVLGRRRRVLSGVGWVAGLLALATRATTVLRVIAQLRAIYLSFKATRRTDAPRN
jgi:MYXO-CTERM domain-containing protein